MRRAPPIDPTIGYRGYGVPAAFTPSTMARLSTVLYVDPKRKRTITTGTGGKISTNFGTLQPAGRSHHPSNAHKHSTARVSSADPARRKSVVSWEEIQKQQQQRDSVAAANGGKPTPTPSPANATTVSDSGGRFNYGAAGSSNAGSPAVGTGSVAVPPIRPAMGAGPVGSGDSPSKGVRQSRSASAAASAQRTDSSPVISPFAAAQKHEKREKRRLAKLAAAGQSPTGTAAAVPPPKSPLPVPASKFEPVVMPSPRSGRKAVPTPTAVSSDSPIITSADGAVNASSGSKHVRANSINNSPAPNPNTSASSLF